MMCLAFFILIDVKGAQAAVEDPWLLHRFVFVHKHR